MEGKNPQPTPQQEKPKKNMAPIIIIIVVLVLVIIPIVVGLFFWNSARKAITGEIFKKGLEQEIDNASKPDEVLDDVADRVDPTIDETIEDEVEDKDAWMKDFDVEFGEFTAVKEGYSHNTKLETIVKNKSNENKTCQIKVDAMSPDGFRIRYDSEYVRDLAPGQKVKVEFFKYVPESEVEDMKTATFEVSQFDVY